MARAPFGSLSEGWRILKTVGTRITKLDTVNGFAASPAGRVLIGGFTEPGFPVVDHDERTPGIYRVLGPGLV